MRDTLYKFEARLYNVGFYKDFSDVDETINYKKLGEDYEMIVGKNIEMSFPGGRKKKKEPVIFTFNQSSTYEEIFEKNYGNPLCSVQKTTLIVVVEKENNKVTFKKFLNTIYRKVGKPYFQKSSRVDYISYNIDSKFIYNGYIVDYHKKKAKKSVRKNFFAKNILNSFLIELKHRLDHFKKERNVENVIFDATDVFTKACGLENDLVSQWDDIIYKQYLNKMGIKYPNNFAAFRTTNYECQPKLKEIRKANMRLVDAYMKKNNLSGKVLKKALHEVEKININCYKNALKQLGPDIINNDYELTRACLEYSEEMFYVHHNSNIFKEIFSGLEFERVLKVFRDVIINKSINLSSFWDHVTYYRKLKKFGEPIKWKSEKIGIEFQNEHMDWVEKVSQYETGFYERIYPDKLEKICCVDIIKNGIVYKPVLLKNSKDYIEESHIQSNCVKTYIKYPNTIIFSLRKGDDKSNERATIEYRLVNVIGGEEIIAKNVQSRTKYNGNPTEEWMLAIKELDKLVLLYVNSDSYENVKLKKTCKNGVIFESNSHWNGSFLDWKESEIIEDNFYL